MPETDTSIEGIPCGEPGCDFVQSPGPTAKMHLGLHRRRAHGIAGKSEHKPSGRRQRQDKAPKAPTAAQQATKLERDLRSLFALVGTMTSVVDPYCGAVIRDRSGSFCKALADLARHDPRVLRWLTALGTAGPYGALAFAGAEIALPIAYHHKMLDDRVAVLLGLPPIVNLDGVIDVRERERFDADADAAGKDDGAGS